MTLIIRTNAQFSAGLDLSELNLYIKHVLTSIKKNEGDRDGKSVQQETA